MIKNALRNGKSLAFALLLAAALVAQQAPAPAALQQAEATPNASCCASAREDAIAQAAYVAAKAEWA